jgi:rhodanese-related sulfurtransferase
MNQLSFRKSPQHLLALLLLGGVVWWAGTVRHGSPAPHYDVPQVNLPQAKALIDAGAVVIDVRDKDKYGQRHIPGAIALPLESLRAGIPDALVKVKAKSVVVVYCSEGAVNGPEATHILQKAGFTRAVNLEPGLEGWAKAGLPLQTGTS